jgi:hypothetical protein
MASLFKKKVKTEGVPTQAGDIAVRPYRKTVPKGHRKAKERLAFEAKLKEIATGYHSKKVCGLCPNDSMESTFQFCMCRMWRMSS